MRLHKGTANQAPDSLIEGIEGTGNATAYRGTAYVVFDSLQMLIPCAGERVYDAVVHTRDLGGGATTPENEFAGQDMADWNTALDDLDASLPNAGIVLLVVGWFGDDLRAANCAIRPKVEISTKTTTPNSWKVHTLTRGAALVVSTFDGRPVYGGTPSDDSVVRAIRDLKARGHSVIFYPFVFMDIAESNNLPDP